MCFFSIADSPKSSPSSQPERRSSSSNTSPPPAIYTSKNEATTPTNGSTPPTTPLMAEFSMSIDGSCRVPDTSSAVRNTCRDMIYKAMKKGLHEGNVYCIVSCSQTKYRETCL